MRPRARGQEAADRQQARGAGLRYVLDTVPGIRRRRRATSFYYVNDRGHRVRDARTLERIKSLVIPPAWTDVWICPYPNGHLQATGYDKAGRKQYRYDERWREAQDHAKYQRLVRFAHALPRIHKRIAADLRRQGLPRRKVLAGVIRLLETTLIRVGNEEYAETNHSYGLTTMQDRHAKLTAGKVQLDFRGKSQVDHEIAISNPGLVRLVRECRNLPGRELFQYVDSEGAVHDVHADDVNDYLRSISGGDFTAKDFRTWAGTALAAQALQEFEDFDSKAGARRNIRQAIEQVAKKLGNTTAVCRKSYIHPAIFDAYLDHSLAEILKQKAENTLRKSLHDLSPEEAAVLALLQQRMARKSTHRSRQS